MKAVFLAAALAAIGGAPAVAGQSPPPEVTVRIRMFAYVPAKVSVPVGTVVRFVNDDSEAHTVTSVDRTFDSGGLDTGDVWTHRFSSAGTFAYFCALHPYMKGTVVVAKARGGAK
jgi:plastocyanin